MEKEAGGFMEGIVEKKKGEGALDSGLLPHLTEIATTLTSSLRKALLPLLVLVLAVPTQEQQ